MRILSLTAFILSMLILPARAQESGVFLKLPISARAAGMGDAFVAVSNEPFGAYYNPAGIAFVAHPEASFAHHIYLEDINGDSVGLVYPINNFSVALAPTFFKMKDEPIYDSNGNDTGQKFGYQATIAPLTVAGLFGDLAVGVTAKYYSQKIGSQSSQTNAYDAGAIYRFNKLRFGFSAQNLGGKVFDYALVQIQRAGLAYIGKGFVISADSVKEGMSGSSLNVGGEFLFSNVLKLRGGWRAKADFGGPTLGLGVDFGNLILDYALISYGDLGDTQKMGISYKFCGTNKKSETKTPATDDSLINKVPLVGNSTNVESEFMLKDGTKLKGEIVSEIDGVLKVKTKYGTVSINRSDIQEPQAAQLEATSTRTLTFQTIVTDTATRLLVYMEAGVVVGTETFDAADALISTAGSMPDGTYTEYYADGVIKAVKPISDGKSNGTVKAFYPSGAITLEAKYTAGEKDGQLKYYTEQGELLMEATYSKNLLNGWKKEYGPGGAMLSASYYINNIQAESPSISPLVSQAPFKEQGAYNMPLRSEYKNKPEISVKGEEFTYTGNVSLGVGYPYVSLKYDFKNTAAEGRFVSGLGVQAYMLRGYWKYHLSSKLRGFTGLEGGYIKFNTLDIKGTGNEVALFAGGEYLVTKNFSLLMDFAPTLISLKHNAYSDITAGSIEYVVNFGVYYHF